MYSLCILEIHAQSAYIGWHQTPFEIVEGIVYIALQKQAIVWLIETLQKFSDISF